jgi:phosphatidate cytidylyltransferase
MISINSQLRLITAIFLITGLWALFFYCPPIIFSIVILIAMLFMLVELKNMLGLSLQFLLFAPIYPIIPCMILIYLNQSPEYKILLHYLFMIVFTFDSASYLAGKTYGKFWTTTKIVPNISPGKSWEGACGGYLITTCLLLMILAAKEKQIEEWHIDLLSAIICIIAFAGDIFESYLKRSANIKDSGTILPGHGGLLDRFDAILFVSYFFFIFKDCLTWLFI